MTAKRNREIQVIRKILEDKSLPLSKLYLRTAEISDLQDKICTFLSPPLNQHLKIANFDDKTLTLVSDTPAWAARLRFKIPEILKFLNESCGLNSLHTVRIKINLPVHEQNTQKEKPVISDKTARLFKNLAESTDDSALRSSLLKLSKHQKD